MRLYSDGDTAGGTQSNAALAEAVVSTDGTDAEASATAEVSETGEHVRVAPCQQRGHD